jgi:hypothetical protein
VVGGLEQVGADILAGQVVTGRVAGLVQQDGPVRLGQLLAAEGDDDVEVGWGDRDRVSTSHVRVNRRTPVRIPGDS